MPTDRTQAIDRHRELHAEADGLVSDLICEGLNETIRLHAPHAGEEPAYAPTTRDLLRRAWTLAAQLQHRGVVADHIIVAMLTGGEHSGAPRNFAGADEVALRVRALTRLARLETTLRDEVAIPGVVATRDVAHWIWEAAQVAQARPERANRYVEPDDLVEVARRGRPPDRADATSIALQHIFDRFAPGDAEPETSTTPFPGLGVEHETRGHSNAEVGSQEVGARLDRIARAVDDACRAVTSLHQTTSRARTEGRRLNGHVDELTSKVTTLIDGLPKEAGEYLELLKSLETRLMDIARADDVRRLPSGEDVAQLASRFADADRRTTENLGTAIGQLATIDERVASAGLSAIAPQLTALDRRLSDLAPRLSAIDRRTADFGSKLAASRPPPPTAGRLALAIVGVLALGIAGAIGLSYAAQSQAAGDGRPYAAARAEAP